MLYEFISYSASGSVQVVIQVDKSKYMWFRKSAHRSDPDADSVNILMLIWLRKLFHLSYSCCLDHKSPLPILLPISSSWWKLSKVICNFEWKSYGFFSRFQWCFQIKGLFFMASHLTYADSAHFLNSAQLAGWAKFKNVQNLHKSNEKP